MGLLYLFALVTGLGILLVQVAFGKMHGGGGGGDGGGGDGGDGGGGAGGKDVGAKDLGIEGDEGVVGLFLSTRFWVFTALGFGLSGALLSYVSTVGPILTFVVAFAAGISSGLFAALTFRVASKTGVSSTAHASHAVGRVGRAVAAVQKGSMGKVRIELQGQVVDFLATTDDELIARGDAVLIEDMKDGVAHVSRRPSELG